MPSKRKPHFQRFSVHYDTVPHWGCLDPRQCECNCDGCRGARRGQWVGTRRMIAAQKRLRKREPGMFGAG
ncbi:MAG: hypothetical protein KGL39_44380 [Patescibacteria group bacterium]|nr:hypothetical protein [Patescibacteria group bacterium]